MRALRRAERTVIAAFGRALPVISWAFFLVGLAGAIGTAVGVLPPFTSSLWAKITTILLWLLFAREGYESLAEDSETT